MISRFLKTLSGPSLEDPDPDRRLRALERLADDTPPEALAEFAVAETDAGVRRACLARIDDAPTLLALMEQPLVQTQARDRLAALIDAGLDARALLAGLDDLALVRHLLDATNAQADWQAVLARLDGEDLLQEIAGHHRLAAVRAAAAERVIHEDALRNLERIARERDKDVARSVRERLDALRAARTSVETLGARFAELAAEARHLARAEDEPRLVERLEFLRGQCTEARAAFEALAPQFAAFELPAPELPPAAAELDTHLDSIAARLEAQARAEAEAEAAEQALRERQQRLETVLAGLERLAGQLAARLAEGDSALSERGALEAAVAMEQARWTDSLGDEPAPPPLARRHEDTSTRLAGLLNALAQMAEATPPPDVPEPDPVPEALPADADSAAALWARREGLQAAAATLDTWLGELAWPEDVPQPDAMQAARERAGRIHGALAAIDAHARHLSDRVGKLCARLERALDARKLKPAGGMHADLQRQLVLLPDDDPRRTQRVERIRERLEELRDWEYFATAPKREDLCARIEALAADESVPAEARAAEVKSLRAEWKALGPVRGDDGKALAKRFDAAAETAFAPARAHFEAEAERRAENTANRLRICDELQQFMDGYDWDNADWKAVERIHRRARDDWKRFADVDARGRSLGKRYHRLSRTLHERLEGRWKANIARKEALVEQARALVADGEPVAGAAAAAKDLQAQWKEVDITPRSVDKTLWKDFRAACDAVFDGLGARREAEVQGHVGLRDTLDAATAALTAALAALPRTPLPDRAALDALPTGPVHAAFDALRNDPVPREQRSRTDAALRSARNVLDEVRSLGRTLQAGARLERLRSGLLLDLALASEAPDAPAADELPTAWRSALEARRSGADDAGAARHAACVDLELALGQDSPKEDSELRLARQVARLSAGMRGEADDDPEARIEDAVVRLLACPAGTPADVALAQRALAAFDAHAARALGTAGSSA